jgi:hypothetical protein
MLWPHLGLLWIRHTGDGAAAAERESWEVERRAQMHFLCEWRSNVPGGRSFSAPFCDDPDMPIGKALVAYDAWWGHVFEGRDLDAGNGYRQRFKEEWADSETLKQLRALESQKIQARLKEEKDREERLYREALAKVVAEREQREQAERDEARERAAAAKRHAKALEANIASKAGQMTETQLCAAWRSHSSPAARAEIAKRALFTDAECALLFNHQIAIGMSERVLLCTWGDTRVNSTIIATRTHRQYVYPGTWVYVENGVITSLQTSR